MPPRHLLAVPTLAAVFGAGPLVAQDEAARIAQGMRVESEAKLDVPQAIAEEVWQYLLTRYAQPRFLDRDGKQFTSSTGIEDFRDVYFDTPRLELLERDTGVRHRTRNVREGSRVKDGRQLVQIKTDRSEHGATHRAEVKFEVALKPRLQVGLDAHPVLRLVRRSEQDACLAELRLLGVAVEDLHPVLTLEQLRRRVYVHDRDGAVATLTLDQVRAGRWGAHTTFTEVEIELNEIRYTQADAKQRAWLDGVLATLQQDLLGKFPSIKQDQTPKYAKAFHGLEASSPLPLRTLVAWRCGTEQLLAIAGLLAVGTVAGAWALLWRARRRPSRRDGQQQAVVVRDLCPRPTATS